MQPNSTTQLTAAFCVCLLIGCPADTTSSTAQTEIDLTGVAELEGETDHSDIRVKLAFDD